MDLNEALQQCPHLASPAALARADLGTKFLLPRHLAALNKELVEVPFVSGGARLIVNLPFQHGKQIADDERVPTPRGWVRHGDLAIGDEVYAPDGTAILVEAVGRKSAQDCAVEFSDGSVIRCHENHEWVIFDRGMRRWRVMSTAQMERRVLVSGEVPRCVLQVANAGPLAGTPWEAPPLAPYALGAWLGDGRAEAGQICYGEGGEAVIDGVAACGFPVTSRWRQAETGVCYAQFGGLKASLREAGVWSDKHVPLRYLTAAAWQREELLAGLIDTDGSYSEDSGQYRFTNTNQRLIDAVVELARSLGFRVGQVQRYEPACSSSGIEGRKEVMVVAFTASRALPCRLSRKVPRRLGRAERRGVVAVHRAAPCQGNCIQVDGGQYLVGETLVPTHNSWLASYYFIAWYLLLWPESRIIFVGPNDRFSAGCGVRVRDVILKFGGAHGVNLRQDSKAKDEWVIEGHGGGLVCRGAHGSILGRPADLLVMDDLVATEEEAMSPHISDKQWDWYCTTAFSRLGPEAGIVAVGTRWGPRDIYGRILAEAKLTGEKWRVVKYRALAGENDELGRKPGEALWPERVPQARLDMLKDARPKWFKTCWQQEPENEEGNHFRPGDWPVYDDLGDAYSLQAKTGPRTIVPRSDVTIFITVDWAASERKGSDFTAIVVFALVPDGRVLILECVNRRYALEAAVPALAEVCRRWRPSLVACEVGGFQAALANECRRYPEIGEVRRLVAESRPNAKLRRALPAILMGENKRILLPRLYAGERDIQKLAGENVWLDTFTGQLQAFTGIDDEHDDLVDALAYGCQLAAQLRPVASSTDYGGPVHLTAGKDPYSFGGFF